jgi:septum formation protein
MSIILASGSPRRSQLLSTTALNFSIMSVDIDETPDDNELPTAYIQRMVATKTKAAIEQLNKQLAADDSSVKNKTAMTARPFVILTADTIGVLADAKSVLVKPIDRDHAYSMWQKMSDDTHQVWTAVQATQVQLAGSAESHYLKIIGQQQIIECTDVTFVLLTPAMMADYWDSGEPSDKAGGYGIQGLAAAWVSRINGSYTNVVGLPLAQTVALINTVSHAMNEQDDRQNHSVFATL